jgi:hypothetical protein
MNHNIPKIKGKCYFMYQPDRPIAEFIKWPEGRVEHALANLRASGEIKSRASRRCGELSKELEKTKPDGTGYNGIRIPTNGKPKIEILKKAGLTKSTAYRYEDLASVPIKKYNHSMTQDRAL